jgi:hypothetical protein
LTISPTLPSPAITKSRPASATLSAGRTIAGSFDLGQVASPIPSHIRLENCRFAGSFVASSIVSLTGFSVVP